ncbi:hypothetical protein [Nocardioides sp.]|uniref:hypothetical protein n=1 Tax=Nocardioides sp. TaxID=35761 RepID=UPI0035152EEC
MSEYQQERKGFWHEPGGEQTSEAIALEAWVKLTHPILEEVAADYHAVIREADLAERLLRESHLGTTRPHEKWLPKVLAPLARVHARDGFPPLTALVVDHRGYVGERYDDVLRAADQLPLTDVGARERHAAVSRLACYVWAGSAPEDGGVPAALPRATSTRTRTTTPRTPAAPRAPRAARTPAAPKAPAPPKRVHAVDRPVAVCPRCFMALPATGLCDTCD